MLHSESRLKLQTGLPRLQREQFGFLLARNNWKHFLFVFWTLNAVLFCFFLLLTRYEEIHTVCKTEKTQKINMVCIDISKGMFLVSISWNFVTLPVRNPLLSCFIVYPSPDEIMASEHQVCSLLVPKSSHMDFNIGVVLYFASRGRGKLLRSGFNQENPNRMWWEGYVERKQGGRHSL